MSELVLRPLAPSEELDDLDDLLQYEAWTTEHVKIAFSEKELENAIGRRGFENVKVVVDKNPTTPFGQNLQLYHVRVTARTAPEFEGNFQVPLPLWGDNGRQRYLQLRAVKARIDKFADLTETVNDLAKKLDRQNAEFELAKASASAQFAKFTEVLVGQKRLIADLTVQHASRDEAIADLTAKLASRDEAIADLTAKLASRDEAIDDLAVQLGDLAKINSQVVPGTVQGPFQMYDQGPVQMYDQGPVQMYDRAPVQMYGQGPVQVPMYGQVENSWGGC